MKEQQRLDTEKEAYEAGEYEKESFWHAVAVTAEMFDDYCQERLNKEDAE